MSLLDLLATAQSVAELDEYCMAIAVFVDMACEVQTWI